MELPGASCKRCETKTGGAEQSVLRRSMGVARRTMGFKSKKAKDTPTHVEIAIGKKGHERPISVLLKDYPTIFYFPILPPPGLLSGAPEHSVPDWPRIHLVVEREKQAELTRKYKDVEWKMPMAPTLAWARMLAKIAYSWVVAEKGYGSFKPFVCPLIRQQTKSFSQLIGSDEGIKGAMPPVGTGRHTLEQRNILQDGRIFVVVVVNFFLGLNIPPYLVVVGEAESGNDKFPPTHRYQPSLG